MALTQAMHSKRLAASCSGVRTRRKRAASQEREARALNPESTPVPAPVDALPAAELVRSAPAANTAKRRKLESGVAVQGIPAPAASVVSPFAAAPGPSQPLPASQGARLNPKPLQGLANGFASGGAARAAPSVPGGQPGPARVPPHHSTQGAGAVLARPRANGVRGAEVQLWLQAQSSGGPSGTPGAAQWDSVDLDTANAAALLHRYACEFKEELLSILQSFVRESDNVNALGRGGILKTCTNTCAEPVRPLRDDVLSKASLNSLIELDEG